MRRCFWVSLVIFGTLWAALPCLAVEFAPIGSEAMSMGGAGVASSWGAYAPYYNPALLAERHDKVDIRFAVGVAAREVNLAEHIDAMSDLNINEDFRLLSDNTAVPADPQRLLEALRDVELFRAELQQIERLNGLEAMPGVNLGCQVKGFGFGVYTVSDVAASAVIDPNHLDIIVERNGQYYRYDSGGVQIATPAEYAASSLKYALDNKLTYLNLVGLAYLEVPIAYGHRFDTPLGALDAGASVKIMPGRTVLKKLSIDTESGDVDKDLKDNDEQSTSWGVDLGVVFKPAVLDKLSVGVVGKNLNTPKFKTTGPDDLEVKPQVRMGTAYAFLNDKLTAAVDVDLTENETFIPGYDTRYVGGGLNFRPGDWFSLRAGAMQNLADSSEGTILTLGFGLGLKQIQLDLAAMASTKTSEYSGSTIPRYAKVQLGLSSRW